MILFLLLCLHAAVSQDFGPTPEREESILQNMWQYEPELPRHILSQAVGMQGDRTRLERVMAALIRGGLSSLPVHHCLVS